MKTFIITSDYDAARKTFKKLDYVFLCELVGYIIDGQVVIGGYAVSDRLGLVYKKKSTVGYLKYHSVARKAFEAAEMKTYGV